MTDTFPDIDLYPLHDKDGFLEFALGLWFHTRAIAGKPTQGEVRQTLMPFGWSHARIEKVLATLARNNQVEVPF
jgi:hypothetical protein